MSQVGLTLGVDQKTQIKDNSATSLDGRDMLDTAADNQSNVLFAVQRCLSRHEIDKAKEEIIYDEHLNPKSSFLQQLAENQQQDLNDKDKDKDGPLAVSPKAPYPNIQICDIDQPMEDTGADQNKDVHQSVTAEEDRVNLLNQALS